MLPGNEAVGKRVQLKKREMEHLHETLKQLEEENQSLGQSLVDQEQTKKDIEASIKIISSDFEKVRVLDRIEDNLFLAIIFVSNNPSIFFFFSLSDNPGISSRSRMGEGPSCSVDRRKKFCQLSIVAMLSN